MTYSEMEIFKIAEISWRRESNEIKVKREKKKKKKENRA